jgi:hypothetical protein
VGPERAELHQRDCALQSHNVFLLLFCASNALADVLPSLSTIASICAIFGFGITADADSDGQI